MEPFYIVVCDDTNYFIEVIGPMKDDSLLTENISLLQDNKMKVHCFGHAGPISKEDGAILRGYKYKEGLLSSLYLDYEKKTLKTLKRW